LSHYKTLKQLFRQKTDKQQRKNKQTNTHTQETTKLTKKNRTGKHKWKCAKCDHVQKKKGKNQRRRFLQEYEIKTSYTRQDGHIG
jgi:ribosomal protein L37AE/L43A